MKRTLLTLLLAALAMPAAFAETETDAPAPAEAAPAEAETAETEAAEAEAAEAATGETETAESDEVEETEAELPTFDRNTHYSLISPPAETQAPEGKTEVLDFFWYGCPHCFILEPLLAAWLEERADTVHARHLPAIFSARWSLGARVYYTLMELDRLDLHAKVFHLVHDQGRPLRSAAGIARMLEPFGIDPKAFTDTFLGAEVDARLEAAEKLTEQFKDQGLGGVPALAVGGRYLITSKHATSYQEILDIADYLIRETP